MVEIHPNPTDFQYTLDRLVIKASIGNTECGFLESSDFGNADEERERFGNRVYDLSSEGKPIYIQLGCGDTPFINFLNLDIHLVPRAKHSISKTMISHVFMYPWLDSPLPIPDNCVDFVFHQDVFEHLPQMYQFILLAEVKRVLKPGRFHRVNTPCIADSMKSSRFEKGLEGVYTEEWTKHGHINVLTRGMLEEMATIVGYSNILFNSKGGSVSGVKFLEYRPGPDRHQLTGSIFADLMK